MKKIAFCFFLILSVNRSFADTDRTYSYFYENVTVLFTTGSYYQEIEKAKMIGKAVAKLSCRNNFKENILLDFIHDYTFSLEPKTILNFGTGGYKYFDGYAEHEIALNLTGQHLVVRQLDSVFDIEKTLKLVEFGIKNIEEIKTNKLTEIRFSTYGLSTYIFHSIDQDIIMKICRDSLSKIGQKTLEGRIYKEQMIPEILSYFTQNNKFILFLKDNYGREFIIDTLPDIRYVIGLKDYYFVFTSWNTFSFYHIKQTLDNMTADKISNVTIEKVKNDMYTFLEVENINNDDFRISHYTSVHRPKYITTFSLTKEAIIETKIEY